MRSTFFLTLAVSLALMTTAAYGSPSRSQHPRVGELAESIGHHPDILLAWGRVKLTVWTHKIDGLFSADFVFAAKADAVL